LAEFFWDRVVNHHSYDIGGNSDHEHFGQPDKLSDRVSPWSTENCNTYNMLKLTRHLFAWNPQASYADYYERALYNQILASQDPRTGMMAYHVPIFGGWFMPYNTPNDSFWCCTGTGVENHAKYGDSIYWHDTENLWINLFIPSELSWRDKGMTLRQETRFPENDVIRLTINCQPSVKATLQIRYPAWAQQGGFIRVNGEQFNHQVKPGSFIPLARTWNDGDQIEVRFPMALRTVPMPDNPNRVAIFYGPVILAGMLGSEGIAPPMPYAKSQGDFFINKTPPQQPVLVTNNRPVSNWLKPDSRKPLTFHTQGIGKPNDVTLTAFYLLPPQRYTLYWDLMTRDQWKQNQEVITLKERHAKELKEKTVDTIMIGNSASESDHKFQGENSASGGFQDQSWRHASDGDWFSYQLKIQPNISQKLLVKYWGSDAGGREFDILIDGVKLATQKLERNKPDQFFEVAYPIPQNLIQSKALVTVKFQAHPGCTAGGIFDCRIIRAK
jgi:hypothetical protein